MTNQETAAQKYLRGSLALGPVSLKHTLLGSLDMVRWIQGPCAEGGCDRLQDQSVLLPAAGLPDPAPLSTHSAPWNVGDMGGNLDFSTGPG